jgi:O-acetyl-ADP-ribose deacetylase (regulator of RNase III)
VAPGTEKIHLIQGDITRVKIQAIVNAANSSLLGGGGVDGAIHRSAGPELREECRKLGGCETGDAKVTKGYRLPAQWVIHTVGPVWRGGEHGEDELLARCYRRCFDLVRELNITEIALPSISTGAYGFPVNRACRIALREIVRAGTELDRLHRVLVVCFDAGTLNEYQAALREILSGTKDPRTKNQNQ